MTRRRLRRMTFVALPAAALLVSACTSGGSVAFAEESSPPSHPAAATTSAAAAGVVPSGTASASVKTAGATPSTTTKSFVAADAAVVTKENPYLSAFPVPDTRTASPSTTITLRGVGPASIGAIEVKGAASAIHAFTVQPDSDGAGVSLIMARGFTPGELVRVTTHLAIPGSVNGTYYFHVALPAPDLPTAGSLRGDPTHAQIFASAPDLTPPVITITKNATPVDEGYLFMAPHSDSLQQGPLIVDAAGNVVWFHPVAAPLATTDFKVQTYLGQQVLTWWQGGDTGGHGYGVDEIYGANYQPIAEVSAGNGYQSDPHDFQVTSAGTALVTAYSAVHWDLRSVGGAKDGVVLDCIMQEVDIRTGLVLFEWHSLDHVAVADSYQPYAANIPYDYFHINSVDRAPSGNPLITSRVTSTVYEVDRTTGKVLWRLGGKHSTYKLGAGVTLSYQHDARWHADGTLTLFDNAVGSPTKDWRSHGLQIKLDSKTKTATLVHNYTYPNGLLAPTQGDVEPLPDGNVFIGFGQRSQFAEFTAAGKVLLTGTMPEGTGSYRTYRFPWIGNPTQPPSAVATSAGGQTTVHVSWNGATKVSSWEILAGSTPTSLAAVTTVPRTSFETAATVAGSPAYVVVRALDAHGTGLGDSPAVAPTAG